MKTAKVSIVNFGLSNLLSVRRAFEYLGADVELVTEPEQVTSAERLVLPGVGAFADGMQALDERHLATPVRRSALAGTPLLGICLGAQLLFDESNEYGQNSGLGLISGQVDAIPATNTQGQTLKVPHMGWADLSPVAGEEFTHPLLTGIRTGEPFYFVHSFHCLPANSDHLIAKTDYSGSALSAVVAENNLFGCQFHPEKSGPAGLTLLRNFLEFSA